MLVMKRTTGRVRVPRGLSMVELMVGLVIGLFIVGGAAYFAVNFSAENRRLLLEARLTQDMRAAMDIVTRDIRRAGYWQHAASGISPFASSSAPTVAYNSTGFAALTPASGVSGSSVTYAYDKSASAAAGLGDQSAFALVGGVLTTTIGNSGVQPLTDANTTTVTAFDVAQEAAVQTVSCPGACPVGGCPQVHIRELIVTLTAQSVVDATIARTLKNRVRVRNDLQTGTC